MNMTEQDTGAVRHRLPAVYLRGVAMGAADIVPGVSGGTIAFITGIYLRLLTAIGNAPRALVTELFRGRLAAFWQAIDGAFLIALFGGILTSIFTLAKLISYLLQAWPVPTWSFFFGLIVASVWHVGREIEHWGWGTWVPLLVGTGVAYWITLLTPGEVSVTYATLFGAGALAICAMILPGISGSFILLLLGLYGPVLAAVKGLQLDYLAVFAAGCVLGLVTIAKVIAWFLRVHHNPTLALLTGFMIGALNKVWPWKQTLSWGVNSHGEKIALVQENLSPLGYASTTGEASYLLAAVGAALLGLILVLGLEAFARSRPTIAKV